MHKNHNDWLHLRTRALLETKLAVIRPVDSSPVGRRTSPTAESKSQEPYVGSAVELPSPREFSSYGLRALARFQAEDLLALTWTSSPQVSCSAELHCLRGPVLARVGEGRRQAPRL